MQRSVFRAFAISAILLLSVFVGSDAHARCQTTRPSTPYIERVDRNLIYFGVVPIRFSAGRPTIEGSAMENCSLPWHSVVELLINGRVVASSSSYDFRNTYNWNTATVPDGEYNIEVRSRDSNDFYDYSSTSVRLRVNNTDVRPEVFDLGAYLYYNPVVASAFPGDATRQVQHWLIYGVNEGRRASFYFHSKEYLESYTDLANAFGVTNYAAGIRHYLIYGLNEKRAGVFALRREILDPAWYLKQHPDLLKAYGAGNVDSARLHFVLYGLKEGRASSPNFAVKNYLARYRDLRKAFGSDYAAAVRHYIIYGIKEKRSGK